MSVGLGSLVGPLIGGIIYDSFGGNVNGAKHPETEREVIKF